MQKNTQMDVKEANELTARAFINWCAVEMSNGYDPNHKDDDINSTITASAIRSKIAQFNLPVAVPDGLMVIIYLCTENNPGQSLLIFHELLEYINNVNFEGKGIPDNYVITTMDFAMCYARSFPLMQDEKRYNDYYEIWQKQKKPRKGLLDSDNQIDYEDFWNPLFERKSA